VRQIRYFQRKCDGQPALCEVLANRDNIQILENYPFMDVKKWINDQMADRPE
jgi:hypothetical protein